MITKLTFPGPDFITGTRGGAMKDPVNVLGGIGCMHTIGRFVRRIKPKGSSSANTRERSCRCVSDSRYFLSYVCGSSVRVLIGETYLSCPRASLGCVETATTYIRMWGPV
jgi:hypothetical protein